MEMVPMQSRLFFTVSASSSSPPPPRTYWASPVLLLPCFTPPLFLHHFSSFSARARGQTSEMTMETICRHLSHCEPRNWMSDNVSRWSMMLVGKRWLPSSLPGLALPRLLLWSFIRRGWRRSSISPQLQHETFIHFHVYSFCFIRPCPTWTYFYKIQIYPITAVKPCPVSPRGGYTSK